MQNTIGSHEPALVLPQDFLDRMTHLWSQPPFSMPTSQALLDGWRVVVDHFHGVIVSNLSDTHVKPSFVLPLPTGAGKTEGTCVYAALQAEKNVDHSTPIGVLIVTRLIADADKVANKINTLVGREVAVAHHSENKLNESMMAAHDVLVVTHQAFMNAAQAFAAHVPDRWNALHIWNRGTRSLIIVDEALANAVDHNAVTGDDLDVALRAVPYHLREQAPLAIKVLETLKTFLARKEEHQAPGAEMVQMLWGEGSPKHAEQIRKLRGELRAVHFDPALYNEEASQTVDAILEDAEVMLDGYAYYYRQGIQHSLNSSRYLLPEGMPGVVILDLCVHKLAKDLAATFSTEALPLNVAWWGAVDGSNQWADCDVAVIFGLPYMDPRRAINNVFAVSGPQDDAWLQSPPVYSQNANVLDVMMQRDVSASIVQAINRIRCRRVTDPEGRCEKADVYIVLPTDWRGDAILDDVRMNMPGINVAPWDFEPDGPKAYAPRSSSAAESVIGLMRDRKPGPVLLSYVQRELSLSRRQLARLKEELAKATSRITTALGELGVIYRVEGRGRGAKSYLVKAA